MQRNEVEILFEKVKSDLLRSEAKDENPLAVILGGQPACGKSSLVNQIENNNPGKFFLKVNGDVYRTYHPEHDALIQQPEKYSAETQIFSNVFTEKLIEEAIKNKYNIIIEGTMRNPTVPLNTAKFFKDNDFNVEAYAIAARKELTTMGIYNRYLEEVRLKGTGRLADVHSHNEAVDGLNKSLDTLFDHKAVDAIYLYNLHAKERIALFKQTEGKWNHWQKPSSFVTLSRNEQLKNQKLLTEELRKGEHTLQYISADLKKEVKQAVEDIQNISKAIDNSEKKGLKI